ncbi:MAG: endonuclease III [Cytophagales bacterium]|nr:endonuclease III [Cytophagales bacterium]
MRRAERANLCWEYFKKEHPSPRTELDYQVPHQLLIAVILSAQCTDRRVNAVTPALFAAFPDLDSLSRASASEVLPYISSVSYPRNKASYLVRTAHILVRDHGGQIPSVPSVLESLPGVGRKTAHVVSSILYDLPVIAVDTHVFRVSHRLGLVRSSSGTPLAVERDLCGLIPGSLRGRAHHWLILHGRYICLARRPRCSDCGLFKICPRLGVSV